MRISIHFFLGNFHSSLLAVQQEGAHDVLFFLWLCMCQLIIFLTIILRYLFLKIKRFWNQADEGQTCVTAAAVYESSKALWTQTVFMKSRIHLFFLYCLPPTHPPTPENHKKIVASVYTLSSSGNYTMWTKNFKKTIICKPQTKILTCKFTLQWET